MRALSQKTSVSIDYSIWQEIKNIKNRSSVINTALRFYLSRKKFIDEIEKKYWDNVEKSILNNDGKYFSLNPDGGEISNDILEEKLWK